VTAKVLLAVRNMGGESEAAWRGLLDDLVSRGLQVPSFVIIDGAAGLEKAVGLVWPEALVQRCTVHKHRNLLAHAPERLHEEISTDYNDMIYAGTAKEVEARRKSFIRKWRLKCRAVADSLEEARDRLFTCTRLPDSQWRSARTTNAVERLHEEFKRRIKTQTVLPSAETAAMLFCRGSTRTRLLYSYELHLDDGPKAELPDPAVRLGRWEFVAAPRTCDTIVQR
jgi:putative transposase